MSKGRLLVRPEWTTLPGSDVTAVEWTDAKADIDVAYQRAQLASTRVFDVREYGAVGDGVADDTAALQDCADECKAGNGAYYIPPHFNCKITSQLDLWGILNVRIEGSIWDDTNISPAIVAGSNSGSIAPSNIFINQVSRPAGRTNTTIRLQGLKNADVKVMRCYKLQLWADASDPAIASLAYNRFLLGNVFILDIRCAAYPAWINENFFYGGRVQELYITGSYETNHNKFIISLEHATIVIDEGTSNIIESRFEGGATITFGPTTYLNRVVRTWATNSTATSHTLTVNDSGFRNQVMMIDETQSTWRTIWRADSNTPTTNTTRNTSEPDLNGTLGPGFRKVRVGTEWGWMADTGIVPIAGLRTVNMLSDQTYWRLYVEVFDSAKNRLNGASTWYVQNTGGIWAWSAADSNFYTAYNAVNPAIRIPHPDVAYVRIRVRVAGGTANSWFQYAELRAVQPDSESEYAIVAAQRSAMRSLTATVSTAPTESLLIKGEKIVTPTGVMNCIERVDTRLSANAGSGATSISVASATGMANGDKIAICLTNDTTHFTTIAGISGTTITLTAGLPSAAASGREVATQRWLHIT